MSVISFVAKFSWASLFILVWLKALGFMASKPGLTWGALIIFGFTALATTAMYIGMESVLWDRTYPKSKKTVKESEESDESES